MLYEVITIFDDQGRLLLAFGSPGAGRGQFWLPNEIFIDRNDRIYVSDSQNQRVQVFQYLDVHNKLIDLKGQSAPVITSYSIHYTKLYEVCRPREK